jgi:hypothetical protein
MATAVVAVWTTATQGFRQRAAQEGVLKLGKIAAKLGAQLFERHFVDFLQPPFVREGSHLSDRRRRKISKSKKK